MLQKAVAKRDPDTYEPWMKALMCAVGQACDWTDRAYLESRIRKSYPGYKFIDAEVRINDINGGFYIYARMVRD